jgi:hypothetical protein
MSPQVEMTYSKSKISLDDSQQKDAVNAYAVIAGEVVPTSTEDVG